jgi:hypothetical protein
MKTASTSLLVLLLACGSAAAQDAPSLSRFELRASGGGMGFGDNDALIDHLLVGVSLRISIAGGLGVEPELSYLSGPGSDRDIVLVPVVSWEFGKKRVRPYVLGAAGGMWHRQTSTWKSEYHAAAGFGIRAQLSNRWSVSPEFRVGGHSSGHDSGDPLVGIKVGVGYRF